MKCLSESKIEKHILASTHLTDEERYHLFQCDRCRERFETFTEFYHEYLSTEQTTFEYWKGLLEQSSIPYNAITLHPIKIPHLENKYPYRLAAQGGQPSEKFAVYHFSNETEAVVGRVMQDKQNGEVSLFLIAENMEKVSNQKVKLLDSNLEAVTDTKGTASFGVQTDFKCSSVQIQSPLAVFDLTPHKVETQQTKQHHTYLLKNENHDEIHIEIDQAASQTSYRISIIKIKGAKGKKELQVVALTDKNRTLSQTTKEGITVFETDHPERILRIQIF